MLSNAPRLLLLGLVLASLACGTTKKAPATGPDGSSQNDGGSDDVAACGGKTSAGCVAGFPSDAGGVWCGDFVMPATCHDDQWTCPSGMVFESDCTCGAPGISCSPQICTPAGPVCLDAGTAPDSGVDAADDGPLRCQQPVPTCDLGDTLGTGVACSGYYSVPARCFMGTIGSYYSCPEGSIPRSTCTCVAPQPTCAGVLCTANGWVCPDGGA